MLPWQTGEPLPRLRPLPRPRAFWAGGAQSVGEAGHGCSVRAGPRVAAPAGLVLSGQAWGKTPGSIDRLRLQDAGRGTVL